MDGFEQKVRVRAVHFIKQPVVAALGNEGLNLGAGNKNGEEEHRATFQVGL